MEDPESASDRIAKEAARAYLEVLGVSPTQAMAQLYMTSAQATGLEMLSAAAHFQELNSVNVAATAKAVESILSAASAPSANAPGKGLPGDQTETLLIAIEGLVSVIKELIEKLPRR